MCTMQICPSTGRPCDCGAASNSNGSSSDLTTTSSGSDDELHPGANGHSSAANGTHKHDTCAGSCHQNGAANGTTDSSAGVKLSGAHAPSDSDAKKADGVKTVKEAQPAKRWTSAVEPIFPAELRKRVPAALTLPGPYATWHRSADISAPALYGWRTIQQ